MSTEAPPARIDVILARRARTAVVFRRGPSKWTLALRWDTAKDTFTAGDWLRGRVYTRRGDLSPDGRHLVYFAAKFRPPSPRPLSFGYAWTAISEVPSLDPLGLWVKDDCWFGGGLFSTDRDVELNEWPDRLVDQRRLHRMRVTWNERAGGEDEPIYARRQKRDGWVTTQDLDGEWQPKMRGFQTTQPQIRVKGGPRLPSPGAPVRRTLEAAWSVERYEQRRTFALIDEHGERHALEGVGWADWDHGGRLTVAREGRIEVATVRDGGVAYETLIDLNPLTPPGRLGSGDAAAPPSQG